jgi:Zn-dependent M28 family amino/carboxypeptidase
MSSSSSKSIKRILILARNRVGLVGSLYYGQHLSEDDADAIRFYFNYDMIGSKQPQYSVYAGSDAHKTGGHILFDYLQAKGKDVYYG